MGKAKKGKRSGKDDDFDSDADVESQSTIESSKSKMEPAKDKKKKKGEVDNLANELDDLQLEKPDKSKNKKGKRASSDIEDDDEVVVNKNKSKEKKKKGKKARDSDDDDNEDDEDSISTKMATKKNKVNSKKNKKKNEDDSEDESIKVKGKTKKGKKVSVSDEEFDILPPQPVSNKQKVKSGFALLNMDNDDDDDDEDEVQRPDSDEEEEKPVSKERSKGKQQNQQKNQEPQGKKGKKARKKHDSDDELEKALAELEIEYSGKKPDVKEEVKHEEESKDNKKKKKEKNEPKNEGEAKAVDDTNEVNESSTVKTAAQKKKEKKEREKQKKLAQKKTDGTAEKPEATAKSQTEPKEESSKKTEETAEDAEDDEKKKKKKGGKEDPKDKGKGPGKKMIAAMQEALKKLKEDEERAKREEEERIRQEELREKARLEQLQLEQERKEKKKLKEKLRKERLKAEGKLLTSKQKQDRARALIMLEYLKAQGSGVPEVGEKKTKSKSLGTRLRPNKMKQQSQEEKDDKENKNEEQTENEQLVKDEVQVEIVDKVNKAEEKPEDEVKDSWDVDSSEGERHDNKSDEDVKPAEVKRSVPKRETKIEKPEVKKEESSDSENESDDESDNDSVEEKLTDAEKKKESVRERIQKRRIEAEKKKSLDNLRAAVVCVLGHVDTGKTKILDKLRRTNVQDSEAGGITQQIGATNVPIDAIIESTKHVKGAAEKIFKLPGLLIIDTPGHESFSNLRNRGSSLCDIAILVVDIMHGLEPQTIESINLLKAKKCPFVVALNKIDRLYDWQTMNRKDVQDIIKSQAANTQREFERRSDEVILQFAEQGLNAALFYKNPDPRSYVSLVPTSAITGEGMGNLLSLIVDACQGPLAKRLMYSEELQATVLEVKALPGLGTTIDCILVNGTLREGETMIVAGTDGPIVTTIRSLLMPQPLKELRVKNAYMEYKEIKAAQGVKIAAKELEKAIAGLNLLVAHTPDEVDFLKEEIAKELTKALGSIKLAEHGVYVQASTLGALEALLDFLKTSKIPYAGIKIGPVVKKDVTKASAMLQHDSQYATILAFDVKIEREAQEQADLLGVKIFQADIIYHLFDKFTAYKEELKQRKREEFKHIAVFPCKLRILPQFIFNSRDPIVVGVMVEAGIVKEGTPVCVPSKDFIDLGVVTSIEYNHKAVESARKGQEVCVKIEPVPGEAPKMFGRHFDETDFIVSKISRQSIDACKDYFRDDLIKTDWQLMVELKKLFQIL
ncbi:LOW QUALITY PROTEIN: eukaryotic translation initiation factor 5B [Chelonus insularis]|uniref:LOW QUALITY PROTEIN: eukaryotic translation initiation factor 5B n=1 Tax=Chelonus insularis TaxID=460826 RepID=UPI00158C7DF6|nr:LOW QUALITY PROTEIN: eukaryotic translation initiation factor 5B-like [Chelonus insularis]